jgi:hypothetical protein
MENLYEKINELVEEYVDYLEEAEDTNTSWQTDKEAQVLQALQSKGAAEGDRG